MLDPVFFDPLYQAMAYTFTQPQLLRQALTHRSFGHPHNERFEFIGDSILNYTVARMLYDQFPTLTEGELSRLRANLVNQSLLATIAKQINLGNYLFLGEGELKSGGFNRPSILADALEATFAAVGFDTDFYAAQAVIHHLYAARISAIDTRKHAKDAKTRLQEILQARHLALPQYRVIAQSGDAYEQCFSVLCEVRELKIAVTGQGFSRRLAEQQAAEIALAHLEAPKNTRTSAAKLRKRRLAHNIKKPDE